MVRGRPLTAAGAVVWRRRVASGSADARGLELLLVHRPRYDDWTFPKGKPDPGEDLVTTAVREVAEETGQVVRLGHPLPDTRYRVAAGVKQVSYWSARVVRPTDPPWAPGSEVDELRWIRPRDARTLLTYPHDVELLDAFRALRDERAHRSRTLVVIRPDAGPPAPDRLVALLSAHGVRRLVSAPDAACVATLAPFAEATGALLELDEGLAPAGRRAPLERAIESLTGPKTPTAVSTSGRARSRLLAALGVTAPPDGPGVVVHHRRGRALAVEPLGTR